MVRQNGIGIKWGVVKGEGERMERLMGRGEGVGMEGSGEW